MEALLWLQDFWSRVVRKDTRTLESEAVNRPLDSKVGYWAHVLGTIVFDPWISSSAQPKLIAENLDSIPLPLPPIREKEELLAFCDARSSEIDRLSAKISEGIAKLKEYRTALISAAVTGKIDVREDVVA